MKIWRKTGMQGCKFLVVRRDGTVPSWSHFVMGARDPAVPAALIAYAAKARELGMDEEYCSSIEELAADFVLELANTGMGDPDRGPHRADNPAVVSAMTGHAAQIFVRPDLRYEPK